jgi:predicted amidophosphoribosyltransferase
MKPLSPRKTCPKCGHTNRLNAKICTQCGHAFILVSDDGTVRKTCPKCNHPNRLSARVCSQCGYTFVSLRPAKLLRGKKWCPQCGVARRPSAKVCSQCGYHFKSVPAESPVIPAAKPGVTLPPAPDLPTTLPPRKPHGGIEGEPSPYISSDELNRLRRAGPYSPSLVERMAHRLTKKDNS